MLGSKHGCVVLLLVFASACGGSTTSPTPALSRIIGLNGNLAFGDVLVGQTATAALTITNSGNAALTVSGISAPSSYSASWTSGTIAAGGSQAVTIQFAPTAAQSYGGTLTVNGDQTSGTNTISISGTGTAFADTTPPAIVAISFSPATVDFSLGTTTTAFVHLTDVGTGVREFRLFLRGPTNVLLQCETAAPPQDGTINDGTWTCPMTFPAGSAAGLWSLTQLDAFDHALNATAVSGADAAQLAEGVVVINLASDTAPPVIVGVSFSPATVDVSLGAATTTASVHITDVGTGVHRFGVFLTGPADALVQCGTATLPQSGTINDGTWTCQITFPAGSAAGVWPLAEVSAADNALNDTVVGNADAARLAEGVTVISR